MSALPQKPVEAPKKIQKLLKKHNAREAYDILAARIILANERTRDTLPPSRVQTESRKITITERGLEEVRTGRYGRVQLPSQEEARYRLQQWRDRTKFRPHLPNPMSEADRLPVPLRATTGAAKAFHSA